MVLRKEVKAMNNRVERTNNLIKKEKNGSIGRSSSKGGYYDVYYTQNKYSVEKPFEYVVNYYHDFFRGIPFLSLNKLLAENGADLNGKTVLIASSGSGIDAYYLKKMYPSVTMFFSDVNFAGMEKLRSNFQFEPAALTDNLCLSFKDSSFDYVLIAASLHHLKEPVRGLYELLRVAKSGVIVIEPNDSWLARLFGKLGLAHEYEIPHSNYVYRFSKREIEKISNALFLKHKVKCLFAVHRVAKTRVEFLFLRLLNGLANLFCPNQGNYIIFLIKKEKDIPKCFKNADIDHT